MDKIIFIYNTSTNLVEAQYTQKTYKDDILITSMDDVQ